MIMIINTFLKNLTNSGLDYLLDDFFKGFYKFLPNNRIDEVKRRGSWWFFTIYHKGKTLTICVDKDPETPLRFYIDDINLAKELLYYMEDQANEFRQSYKHTVSRYFIGRRIVSWIKSRILRHN